MQKLSIRALEEVDITYVVSYWHSLSEDDIKRMGIDPTRIPSADIFREKLRAQLTMPSDQHQTFYMIWLIDNQPVGYACLKDIKIGESGSLHLHMWSKEYRGKGYGGQLFCLSALDFYNRFSLKRIICEPRASNPMPNRMLQGVGFPLIKTHVAASSELSDVCELNCYLIDQKIAEEFLKRCASS
jgi:RimJ/RimL family protein N-acetyltransferase